MSFGGRSGAASWLYRLASYVNSSASVALCVRGGDRNSPSFIVLHGYLVSTRDSTCLKFCPPSNLYLFDFLLVNGANLFDSLFRSPHPQHPALTKHYQVCLLDVSVMHPSFSNLAISALAQTFTISHLDLTNSLLAPFELIIQREVPILLRIGFNVLHTSKTSHDFILF